MLNIRKAIISDAESIAKINIYSWQKTYMGIFPADFLESLSNADSLNSTVVRIKENISTNSDYLVAEIDGEVVGFCKIGKSSKEQYKDCGEIKALYVKNTETKKGIGKQLFIEANKQLNYTYKTNIVSCIKDNSSNNFYKKMGCKLIGECNFELKGNIYKENLYKCP